LEPINKIEVDEISVVINILTAMITPAILIVACGSLSLTTSQRLNRSIDRSRKISMEFQEIRKGTREAGKIEIKMLYGQLQKAAQRARLLQKAMTLLYVALGFFIATSLLIGIFELVLWIRSWIIVVLPMVGALALLFASILLIAETRLALSAVDQEMDFRMSSHIDFNPAKDNN
jgi:hypothetical protein